MTGKAIYIFGICERSFSALFPAVACMAGHALILIALRADAKVVDLIDLTYRYRGITPGDIEGLGLPRPVRGLHHSGCGVFMTRKTGAGHILSGIEFTLENVGMIHMHRFLRQIVCR